MSYHIDNKHYMLHYFLLIFTLILKKSATYVPVALLIIFLVFLEELFRIIYTSDRRSITLKIIQWIEDIREATLYKGQC